MSEDARLALANLHALALVTLRAKESAACRARLEALADYAPDPVALDASDPRSDEALAEGVSPEAAARRFAARVRGVVLGAAAHTDTASREVVALVREAVKGEGVSDAQLDRRARAALERTRGDLEQDIVRLGSSVATREAETGRWIRRWGVVRSLELNAFVATFTRDGTERRATKLTQSGADASALRFAMAVAQAAMSLAPEAEVDAKLLADVERTEGALAALLATLVSQLRGR